MTDMPTKAYSFREPAPLSHPSPDESQLPEGSPENPQQGVRARSKQANRQKIIVSARELFRDRGFEAATLREIARNAGLSTGALFANFADKTEIFIKVVDEENTRVVGRMAAAYEESLPLNSRLLHQVMTGYRESVRMGRIILAAFVMKWSPDMPGFAEIAGLNATVRDAIQKTLERARDLKELPQEARIDIATEVLEDLCFSALRRATLYNMSEASVHDRLHFQVDLILAGLQQAAA